MDCRRRSTSQTVYSLCSYVTGWHGADSARTENSGMRKMKRTRPSFEKFSTTTLFDLLDWVRRYPAPSEPATHAIAFGGYSARHANPRQCHAGWKSRAGQYDHFCEAFVPYVTRPRLRNVLLLVRHSVVFAGGGKCGGAIPDRPRGGSRKTSAK
jgi:hypothetical protein